MMIFKKAIPRRTLLRGLGASLALPLLDGMVPALAGPLDTASKPVIRLGIVYVPNGIIPWKWRPTSQGADYKMSPIMEPLGPFRDRILVLSGLDQKPAEPLPGEAGAPHTRASSAYLTGVHPRETDGIDLRAGVSMDQIAAKVLGQRTQLASLELATEPVLSAGVCESGYTCTYMNTLSWRSPTTPMPMEDKPRVVFERLFGDSDTTDSAARRVRNKHVSSLLDSFSEAVGRLQREIGPADRSKLAEYLDAVRDVERRIQLAEEQSNRELPILERPGGSTPALNEDYAKLMFDLQVLAYQTDMTRVITFALARERSIRSYPEIGVPEAHHALTHHRNVEGLIDQLVKINTYHVKLFAYYLGKLRSTPDGDGSLLDHMTILYGSGISDGNLHLDEDLPTLLVGGAGGKIKGGRHIRYPQGTPMTNLYLTMLDMMGVPVESLGNSSGKIELASLA